MRASPSAANQVDIDVSLVEQLVRAQFPEWADLPVSAVAEQGWDNRTFRLGEELSVRLPSAEGYVPGFLREQQTLSLLEPQMEIAVPRVIASGAASSLFPRPWSVRAWLPGRTLGSVRPGDRTTALAGIVDALGAIQRCGIEGGAWAGPASAHRGCHVSALGEEVQRELGRLQPDLAEPLQALWHAATTTVWTRPPSWVHGDIAPGNLLFDDAGRLTALIDFGQSCVGDPACDLAFTWLSCSQGERSELRARIEPDDDTWLRGAVWALWKALITSEEDLAAKNGRARMDVLQDLTAIA